MSDGLNGTVFGGTVCRDERTLEEHEPMADTDADAETSDTRRKRARRFVEEYIDERRELFDKLARE